MGIIVAVVFKEGSLPRSQTTPTALNIRERMQGSVEATMFRVPVMKSEWEIRGRAGWKL